MHSRVPRVSKRSAASLRIRLHCHRTTERLLYGISAGCKASSALAVFRQAGTAAASTAGTTYGGQSHIWIGAGFEPAKPSGSLVLCSTERLLPSFVRTRTGTHKTDRCPCAGRTRTARAHRNKNPFDSLEAKGLVRSGFHCEISCSRANLRRRKVVG